MTNNVYKSLWIGQALSPLERVCIKSFITKGETFELYCYADVKGVPEGCTIKDANHILNKDSIFFDKNTGSPAPFSDWFRYELLKKTGGTWVDTDVFLLKKDNEPKPFLMAEQGNGQINGAILRIPSQHPSLDFCINECKTVRDDVPWGKIGPDLVTNAVNKFKLHSHLSPTYELYPIIWQNWHWLLNPITKSLTERSVKHAIYLHLWNEMISRSNYNKNTPPPPGSYLEQLYIDTNLYDFDYSQQ